MSTTPWSPFSTREPEVITRSPRDGFITIQAGSNRNSAPICRLDLTTKTLTIKPSANAAPMSVEPYRIELPRWTRGSIPVLHLHPFALLHLILTEQGLSSLLTVGHLATMQSGAKRWFLPIEGDCELLRMLGTPKGCMVSLTTHSNLAVRDRA